MAQHSELHAFVGHENPTIVERAAASGGGHQLGDVCDAAAVAAFARAREIDIAMVSADEPLAAGVVDALHAQGTRAVGPTRAGAEIEWNKVFARSLLREVAPESVPRLQIVNAPGELSGAFEHFGETPVAVKPAGLTGGKGVKVMGPHLADHEAARGVRRLAAREGRSGADRGAHHGRRVHDPGDQRRAHGRVPALDLRLPLPLRRGRGSRHRRDGLAVDARAVAAVHERGPLPARRARSWSW